MQNHYPHGQGYYQAVSIWEELYNRCAAIKFPEEVKGVVWKEDKDRERLTLMPRGSMMMVHKGKRVGGHYNNDDPLRIGPTAEFTPPDI